MPPGNKREKRLARQAEALAAFQQKKLRQLEDPNSFKRVAEIADVNPRKVVVEATPARSCLMEWTREQVDVEGQWPWGARSCLNEDWDGELHPFLIEYSSKTWLEIYDERTGPAHRRRQKHCSYEVTQICDDAQYRLLELGRDDVDTIFRFRVAGAKRLYGIQQEHVFFVLWWDPTHKIYETEVD